MDTLLWPRSQSSKDARAATPVLQGEQGSSLRRPCESLCACVSALQATRSLLVVVFPADHDTCMQASLRPWVDVLRCLEGLLCAAFTQSRPMQFHQASGRPFCAPVGLIAPAWVASRGSGSLEPCGTTQGSAAAVHSPVYNPYYLRLQPFLLGQVS